MFEVYRWQSRISHDGMEDFQIRINLLVEKFFNRKYTKNSYYWRIFTLPVYSFKDLLNHDPKIRLHC